MSALTGEKRKRKDLPRPVSKSKRHRRAAAYHSSSEDDEIEPAKTKSATRKPVQADDSSSDEDDGAAIQLPNLQPEAEVLEDEYDIDENELSGSGQADSDESGQDSQGDEDDDTDGSSGPGARTKRKKTKRNDPDAFATSMSKILASKLTTTKRSDPVLSRSKEAAEASRAMQDSRLETAARRKILAERKQAQDKGHVRDVLGLQNTEIDTGAAVEEERRLKKTAQRGVVKLFNAVRAAQVKGEQAAREEMSKGTVGLDKRQERVNEMSKQGFLNLLVDGSKK